jgi:predicted transcriptional regulator
METPLRHFRCDDELWNSLIRIGKEQDRTPSWLVRKAAEEYIERYRAAKRAAKAEPQQ